MQRYLEGYSRNFKAAFRVGVQAYFKMATWQSFTEVVDQDQQQLQQFMPTEAIQQQRVRESCFVKEYRLLTTASFERQSSSEDLHEDEVVYTVVRISYRQSSIRNGKLLSICISLFSYRHLKTKLKKKF